VLKFHKFDKIGEVSLLFGIFKLFGQPILFLKAGLLLKNELSKDILYTDRRVWTFINWCLLLQPPCHHPLLELWVLLDAFFHCQLHSLRVFKHTWLLIVFVSLRDRTGLCLHALDFMLFLVWSSQLFFWKHQGLFKLNIVKTFE